MAKVKVRHQSSQHHNIFDIDVGTNAPKGGKWTEGGRTILRLKDGGSTMLWGSINDEPLRAADSIAILVGGDAEAYTLLDNLEFAVKTIRTQLGYTVKSEIQEGEETEEDIDEEALQRAEALYHQRGPTRFCGK